MSKEIITNWEAIREIEIDPTWRDGHPSSYHQYREDFARCQKRELLPDFPLSVEIEATYYCNLKCLMCPRTVNPGERENRHMEPAVWKAILDELRQHQLPALLLDHEAESLMNPRFFDMLKEAKDAGIYDLWLHSNANLLTSEKSAKLIDYGLTKINFSIDAATAATYDVVRAGGKFDKVVANIREFLRLKMEKGASYLRVRLSFVEQEANIHEKRAFLDMWKDVPGVNMITFQECKDFSPFEHPDEDNGLSAAELDVKYGQLEPFHCSMPWEMPVIDAEGNINPCGSPVREHTEWFTLGNVAKGDTIQSCWQGDKMQALRALHTEGKWYRNDMCRVCVKTLRHSRQVLLAAGKDEA